MRTKRVFWKSRRFWSAVAAAGGAIPALGGAILTGNPFVIAGAALTAAGIVGLAYFGFKGGAPVSLHEE